MRERRVAPTCAFSTARSLLRARASVAPRSLLLSGAPGVGKSAGVQAAARVEAVPLLQISAADTPSRLVSVLARARRVARTSRRAVVVFIDEIDGVCPAPAVGSTYAAVDQATAALVSFLAPLPLRAASDACVFVVAATNRPHAVHPRLLSGAGFHKHVELTPPSPPERFDFLSALLPDADPRVLRYIADRTSGFVAADLASLCAAASEQRIEQLHGVRSDGSLSILNNLMRAFERAIPAVLRNNISARVAHTSWDEIGGMHKVKRRLKMAVEWPLQHAATFTRLGLKAPRGILLHGPPGCSKTSLVRAAACQSRAVFIRLSGADIYSCFLGEAERMLRDAFATARAAKPSILFLDEIDAIVGKRSTNGEVDGNRVQQRVLSTLLTEMDGIVSAEGVLVIAASNRIDLLDDALLRPGRFDDILEVALPDEQERREILTIHTRTLLLHSDVDLAQLAHCTEGYSGADLKAVCSEAGLGAMREAHYEPHKCGGSPLTAPLEGVSTVVAMRHFVVNLKLS